VDQDPIVLYRRALGAFATGVIVVTCEDAEGALGLTANSFTSVSLNPALVLWCMDNRSDRRHAFQATDRFGISILADTEREQSQRFAGKAHRMAPGEFDRGPGGAPLLRGALTRLECLTHKHMELGDHTVIVGEVTSFDTHPGEPLVFFRGRYGRVVPGDQT
jgi:3-hydroxy-9,10-secoandrosta-1,3,5(10)-triene-9,17-dione monooxygenase reductase component